MSRKLGIRWLCEPEKQDYPAALSYLTLLYNKETAANLVARLKGKKITEFKAKDIFRASGLSLLGVSNGHVTRDQEKIRSGRKLSPILLIRDSEHGRLIIADGYHRLCAVYTFDEDAMIPCQVI